ncbi:hypothetical protein AJ80_00076 [Polytolypa hystricis UAMH7299]|uniref:Amidase domain-containing protein n=1 Tax=Polytolypa hystricis (strain UAMH7299) TaxID=1447883 RepID=A0A2B7Z2P4_POLH7|nr:hypothetical protein AJ80_00076 [Polytolypa hystricis UAMH7299]
MASESQPRFFQYPSPREGPALPYKNATESNPVLRGRLLELAASLIRSSPFLQGLLFRNAGLGTLQDIDDLRNYEARYDPTVVPILDAATISSSQSQLPAPTTRRAGNGGYYTSADYHALYLSGELTPTAVAEALLPLIRRDTSPAGEHSIAFIDSKVDIVRAAAAASTERYKNGNPLGPLDGVPVAIKDEVDIEGYKRTLGTKLDFTGANCTTVWCVKQWEQAGAIVVGKTTMHELGLDTTNNNPNLGTPRNPHNQDYYTGGSSGGSGYAVGSGLVPIALGADGGGSIRIPASYCGVYGLKPTHGRVSGSPSIGLAKTTGVYGPLASSLDDLALSYRVMANPDPDSESSGVFPNPLSTLRDASASRPKIIGIFPDWVNQADPDVLSLFNKTIDYYRTTQGYEVIDISIPYIPEGQKAHALTILSEISSGLTYAQTAHVTAANKVLLSIGGTQATAKDFIAAQKVRNLLMRHLAFLFRKHPGLVIATPTVPTPGSKIHRGEADLVRGVSDTDSSLRSMEYVYLANFTGCPAISCPMGYAEGTKVPVGIMGMGEWGSEEALIEWGKDGEGVLGVDDDDIKATSTAATAAVTVADGGEKKGVRTPGEKWVDVIAAVRGASETT